MTKRILVGAISLLLSGSSIFAAEPKKAAGEKYDKAEADKHIALDPAKATPDFAVQGEYVGESKRKLEKFGIQVASLGDGNFAAAFYPGGLPGDGFEGERSEAIGKAADASMKEVVFTVNGREVLRYADGAMKGNTPAGEKMDITRVQRKSPTLGAKPPQGAIVLFDGKNVDAWEKGHMDDRHFLASGTKTNQKFHNFTLHVEFIEPFKPFGRDQDRGNSGIYIQDRYEVQVLDSFEEKPVFNGTGAIYRQTPPLLNMCYPPLSWQTYDIDFASPVYEGTKKVKNAVITVKLNGVTIHDKREITAKTGAGKPEGAEPGPIQLQGHGNPVFYQNIWIVEKP